MHCAVSGFNLMVNLH